MPQLREMEKQSPISQFISDWETSPKTVRYECLGLLNSETLKKGTHKLLIRDRVRNQYGLLTMTEIHTGFEHEFRYFKKI